MKKILVNGYKSYYMTIIDETTKVIGKSNYCLCKCKCGKERYVLCTIMRTKAIRDCGCNSYALDSLKKEFVGEKFNKLKVLDIFYKTINDKGWRKPIAHCICDCGNEIYCLLDEIKRGQKSCGCIQKFNFNRDYKNKKYHNIEVLELLNKDNPNHVLKCNVKCRCHCGNEFNTRLINLLKHKRYIINCSKCSNNGKIKYNIKQREEMENGDLKSILYGIKNRCNYPNRKDHKYYYDKGVKVCDDWLNNSQSFIDWALSNGYKKGLTIDRIDPNGDYEPSNCRWVDMFVQNNNQCNTKKYPYNGEMYSIAELSRLTGINYRTLLGRIKTSKMDIDTALNYERKGNYFYNGKYMSLLQISKEYNVPYGRLVNRVKHQKMSIQDAISIPNINELRHLKSKNGGGKNE